MAVVSVVCLCLGIVVGVCGTVAVLGLMSLKDYHDEDDFYPPVDFDQRK